MPDISMLDLRANLTEILQRAERGETFTVTRFGDPMVIISPVVTVAPGVRALMVKPGKDKT